MRRLFILSLVACAGAALLVAGCGPKNIKVKGRLLKNGQPQTFAEDDYVTIKFVPEDVKDQDGISSYTAKIDRPAGTYEAELPAGKYRVTVFVPPKNFSPPGPDETKNVPSPTGERGGTIHEIKSSMTLDLPIP